MTKLDKDYQKIPRSEELISSIQSFWSRPIDKCDRLMIEIAEKQYINSKIAAFNSKLINEMYCVS